ncbi:MAG: hypothetical protein ACK4TP_19310 [Hyphomicrobium sp.]
MADEKKLYEFTAAGFYAGDHYKAGDQIRLYPKQAQHELHRMKLVVPPAMPAEEPAVGRRSRAKA